MKGLLAFATFVALSLVAAGVLLAQSDPFIGTWKLNLAKSKYAGRSAPKSETRTVEVQGNGERTSYEGVAADGSRIAYNYTTNYDGKDSPISGVGAPNGADTISVKRLGSNTTTLIQKKAGKVIQTTRIVVSENGKVWTSTGKGTNEQGQQTSNTLVWDKQ